MSQPVGQRERTGPDGRLAPGTPRLLALVATTIALIIYFCTFSNAAAYYSVQAPQLLLAGGMLAGAALLPRAGRTLVPGTILTAVACLAMLQFLTGTASVFGGVTIDGRLPIILVVVLVLGFLQLAACVGALLLDLGVLKPASAGARGAFARSGPAAGGYGPAAGYGPPPGSPPQAGYGQPPYGAAPQYGGGAPYGGGGPQHGGPSAYGSPGGAAGGGPGSGVGFGAVAGPGAPTAPAGSTLSGYPGYGASGSAQAGTGYGAPASEQPGPGWSTYGERPGEARLAEPWPGEPRPAEPRPGESRPAETRAGEPQDDSVAPTKAQPIPHAPTSGGQTQQIGEVPHAPASGEGEGPHPT